MVEFGTFAIPVFVVSLIAYLFFSMRTGSSEKGDISKIHMLEKIAQYLSSSQSLDKALRQLIAESPISGANYVEVIKKVDAGQNMEQALLETSDALTDEFDKKALIILANVNKKNDADTLYKSVQSLKESAELRRTITSKSEIGALIIQIVFVGVIPVMHFIMSSMLGFTADVYLNTFLMILVLATALFQGVAFRQWTISIIKIPLLLSLFYLIYYVVAPQFLGGLFAV